MKAEIFRGCFVSLIVAAVLYPALAANPGGSGPVGKTPAATLQTIPGSTVKRVILTPKAAERLGIETGKVSEQAIVRKQMVGGLVIPPMEKAAELKPGKVFGDSGPATPVAESKPASGAFVSVARPVIPPAPMASGGFGGFVRPATPPEPMATGGFGSFARAAPVPESKPASRGSGGVERIAATKDAQPAAAPVPSPAADEAWVLITLSPGEWDRLAKDKPARVLPLATRDKSASEIFAKPSGMQPQEDSKRSMLKLYYVVPGKDHGLAMNKRMRVELQLAGSDETQKVVPYRAVYYDAKGAPWVYVNTQPLTFERQRITVERVVGDIAVLSDGPPLGTPVVITGAALLYGVEIFGK